MVDTINYKIVLFLKSLNTFKIVVIFFLRSYLFEMTVKVESGRPEAVAEVLTIDSLKYLIITNKQ